MSGVTAEQAARVAQSIHNCAIGKTIIAQNLGSDKDEDMFITWETDEFLFEITIFDCENDECGCFSWFFIASPFDTDNAILGDECVDDLSDTFVELVNKHLVI